MKTLRKFVTVIAALVMTFAMIIPTFAAYKETIFLAKNKAWTTAGSEDRSGNYAKVYACCDSVYPKEGMDLFSVIRCRITNSSGDVICDNTVSLTEGKSYTGITLKEGYLATTKVTFQFCGNSNAEAYAIVSYYSY